MYTYDLLLKGGIVVDPAQNIHAVQDVAFAAGKVAAVGPDLPATAARQVLNCRERLVAPGMIDAVVFERQTSQVELRDSHGEVRIGRERLLPVTVIRAGLFYR